jgi:hypothetical protein
MSNFHFELSLTLSQMEMHEVSGEVQNELREGAKQSQGRCVPPLKIQPCLWDFTTSRAFFVSARDHN